MKPMTFNAPRAVAWGLGALILVQLVALGRSWSLLAALQRPAATSPASRRPALTRESALATRIIGAHLFGSAPEPAGDDIARATDTHYSLKGIVALGTSGRGLAIIAPANGRSQVYCAGESISDRVVLREVAPGYVLLLNNSRLERLELPHGSLATLLAVSLRRTQPVSAHSAAALSADTRATLAAFGLNVVPDSAGGITGLSGRGSPSWHRSGLLPSDVIVAIDGTPVGKVLNTPMALDNATVAGVTTLTVLRDGAQMDIEAVPAPARMIQRPRHGS